MRKMIFAKRMLWTLLLPMLFLACEDKLDEHYEVPGWLRGSAWEVLEDEGNYSMFLEGVELAGYKSILQGKSILTVMAPNDEAFTAYLKAHGYSSVRELKEGDLTKLIGFHLLYYSYNKDRMINFRPEGDGATDEDKEANAGLFYKFRTKSANPVSLETNPKTNQTVFVYHLERFVPVFSYRFFATKGIDARSNYEYFYPNSSWTGSEGFNVSNASVKDYQLVADNGYVYTIDKVLEPLETIYTELKNRRSDYSVFFDLYNTYTSYDYDATLSSEYGASVNVDSLYVHKHGDLPPIAMEWPVSFYQSVATLASISYSVFAPSNEALNELFNSFWKQGGYSNLGDIDALVMRYLLYQYVYGGSVVFPEEIEKGKIKNVYGTVVSFDTEEVKDRLMCINGSLYGIKSLGMPGLFSSVAGPAFQYKKYCNYLYMLDGSSLLLSLATPDVSFTALYPGNQQLEAEGIFMKEYATGKSLQEVGDDGTWGDVSTDKKVEIVNMHLKNGGDGLETSGAHVYTTQSAFNYWYVKDGKITTNALFNNYVNPEYAGDPFVALTEVTDNGAPWTNGKAYAYDGAGLFTVEASEGLERALASCNDARYPYYLFVQLLKKANMVSGTEIATLTGSRFVAFIPANDAIRTALANNQIPGVKNGGVSADGSLKGTYTAATLAAYMKSYFVTDKLNVVTTYPYPGSAMKNGDYVTWGDYQLQYTDTGSGLSVQMKGRTKAGNVVSEYDCFPFAYQDGAFHLIDSTL